MCLLYVQMQSRPLWELVWCLHPGNANNAEKLILAELLRCIVDYINHIEMSFVHTNALKTIAKVGVLPPPSKNK